MIQLLFYGIQIITKVVQNDPLRHPLSALYTHFATACVFWSTYLPSHKADDGEGAHGDVRRGAEQHVDKRREERHVQTHYGRHLGQECIGHAWRTE
jgi:uncharacterized membrane protein YccC